jgi:hypothetical protein
MDRPTQPGATVRAPLPLKPTSCMVALIALVCDGDSASTATDELPPIEELTTGADGISSPAEASAVAERNPGGAPTSCEEIAALFTTRGSANADLADPESSTVCSSESIVVSSNGVPDYSYIGTFPGSPNAWNSSSPFPQFRPSPPPQPTFRSSELQPSRSAASRSTARPKEPAARR